MDAQGLQLLAQHNCHKYRGQSHTCGNLTISSSHPTLLGACLVFQPIHKSQ